MDLKNLSQSKTTKSVLLIIVGLVVLLLVFQAGVFVGYHKARFSARLGDNYRQNFGPGRGMGMMGPGFFPDADLPGGHGATGRIVKINLPSVIVADRDGLEKVVTVATSTDIRSGRGAITPADLKVDDVIIAFGSPNEQGAIAAKLIRLLPR